MPEVARMLWLAIASILRVTRRYMPQHAGLTPKLNACVPGTADIFFRKLKTYGDDPPPIFVSPLWPAFVCADGGMLFWLEPSVAAGCVNGSTPMVWYGVVWCGRGK